MSLLQAQRQEDPKYPTSTLLKSSNDLGWSTLFAELRSHSHREAPGPVAPHAKISLAGRPTIHDDELHAPPPNLTGVTKQ